MLLSASSYWRSFCACIFTLRSSILPALIKFLRSTSFRAFSIFFWYLSCSFARYLTRFSTPSFSFLANSRAFLGETVVVGYSALRLLTPSMADFKEFGRLLDEYALLMAEIRVAWREFTLLRTLSF